MSTRTVGRRVLGRHYPADVALGVADPHQASEGEGVAVDFNSCAVQYRKSHDHEGDVFTFSPNANGVRLFFSQG